MKMFRHIKLEDDSRQLMSGVTVTGVLKKSSTVKRETNKPPIHIVQLFR